MGERTMTYTPPEQLNIADYYLDARIREGRGDRTALITDGGRWTYAELQALANRYGNFLARNGIEPEHRVLIALPDGPEFVAALFGALKLGAVVVMVNPGLPKSDIRGILEYTRARAILVQEDSAESFREAASDAPTRCTIHVPGTEAFAEELGNCDDRLTNFPTHRDDPAIWLFSGGTTGRPKAVVQMHRSFANTTECYAKQVIGYREDDITISVPKLYFGYATGSNLFFPFSVGGATVLFGEPPTAENLIDRIKRHRPTILINVPKMILKMLDVPGVTSSDLSSLRVCTSAGEALPAGLYDRWHSQFGIELLDGLGTAEMWHIFISNQPGHARAGTLGTVVPGFEIKACDERGEEVPRGQTGWLWVRGDSRAIGYWQQMEKTQLGFRGEWYVSGDLVRIDDEGYVTYCGRGDEMLKVSGKWLAPQEVEGCLIEHPDVAEAAVVGVTDPNGLVKPCAYIVARKKRVGLDDELKQFVRERLEPNKCPREVLFVDELPRTHLGKVNRAQLRRT